MTLANLIKETDWTIAGSSVISALSATASILTIKKLKNKEKTYKKKMSKIEKKKAKLQEKINKITNLTKALSENTKKAIEQDIKENQETYKTYKTGGEIMKFTQNYKVKKPEYKIQYKQKEYKDETTGTIMKENKAIITTEIKEVKDLYNEIQANREGTELRVMILKQQLDINKLENEGTYLNNDNPINLQELIKTQQEYKTKLEQMKNEALQEKLKKEQENKTKTEQTN